MGQRPDGMNGQACLSGCRRTGGDGPARGHHVVNQHDARGAVSALVSAEGSSQVEPPQFCSEPCLLIGVSNALEHSRVPPLSAQPGEARCEQRTLVEASSH